MDDWKYNDCKIRNMVSGIAALCRFTLLMCIFCTCSEGGAPWFVTLSEESYGTVQINDGDDVSTVCDDGMTDLDAAVICRELGYSYGVKEPWCCSEESQFPILADGQLSCIGNEATFYDCIQDNNDWGITDCSHDEDLYVYCSFHENCTDPNPCPWNTTCTPTSFDDGYECDCSELEGLQQSGQHTCEYEYDLCSLLTCENCTQPAPLEIGCNCTELNEQGHDCEVRLCEAVVDLELNTTWDCPSLLPYHSTSLDTPLLTLSSRSEVLFENGGLESSVDDYHQLSEYCQRALEMFTCMLLQPECDDASLIPMCRSTCQDLLRSCPYEVVGNNQILCDIFPESQNDSICTSGMHPEDGDLRLAARTSHNAGRLEIYLEGEWGSICTYGLNLDQINNTGICEQLGIGRGMTILPSNIGSIEFGYPIHLSELWCPDEFSSFFNECVFTSGPANCSHYEDLFIQCDDPEPVYELYLTHTHYGNDGIVLITINGENGTICDDAMTDNEATVICRELGYDFGIIDDWCCNDPFSDLPIHFDEQFSCLGNETSIFDCLLEDGLEQLGEHDCSHDEDMYVYCKDFATCSPNPCDFEGECEVDDSNVHECSCSVYEGYEDDCHDYEYEMCELALCADDNCLQTSSFTFTCDCNQITDDCYNHTCVPVFNNTDTGECADLLSYPYTTDGSTLLNFDTKSELLYSNDAFEWSPGQLAMQTQTCQDAIDLLACLMLQPECKEGDQIPLCRNTCRDLLERCPYELWDRVDVPCEMFPDSTDPDICTSLTQPQNGTYRLVGGVEENEGRVEIFLSGWGSICTHVELTFIPDSLCDEVGIRGKALKIKSYIYDIEHGYPIKIQDFYCSENVTEVSDCTYSTDVNDCSHFEDLHIQCTPMSYTVEQTTVIYGTTLAQGTMDVPETTTAEETTEVQGRTTAQETTDFLETTTAQEKISVLETTTAQETTSVLETTTAQETTDVPETTTAPKTTDVPETTTAEETTDVPKTTTAEESTDVPETTTAQEITIAQATTDVPETTTAEESTDAPKTTAAQETTDVPETTTAGKTTGVPETTTAQETTAVAETSTAQDTTDVPATTTAGETTDVPEPTTAGETTDDQETTTAQETTDDPETTTAQETTDVLETTTAEETTDVSKPTTAGETTDDPETITAQETTDAPETATAQDTTAVPETTVAYETTDTPERTATKETTDVLETTDIYGTTESYFDCGHHVYPILGDGFIWSPNFGVQNYPAGTNCTWILHGDVDRVIEYYMDWLDVNDCVDVYEFTTNTNQQLIASYCKHKGSARVALAGYSVMVTFATALGGSAPGFKMYYTMRGEEHQTPPDPHTSGCNVAPKLINLNSQSNGHFSTKITSPGFTRGRPYGNSLSCSWHVHGTPGCGLIVLFDVLLLDNTPYCLTDYVEIRKGEDELSDSRVGVFCSEDDDDTAITTYADDLYITFVSDASKKAPGFALEITENVNCIV